MKGEIQYEIRSAYFHVLLARAADEGFVLEKIEKTGENRHTFWISAGQKKAFTAFYENFHPDIRIIKTRGFTRAHAFFRRRPALIASLAAAAVLIYFLSLRVWVISAPDERFQSALTQLGIRPGMKKTSVNPSYLSGALTTLFPEYAHVGIRLSGVCLYAEAAAGDPAPEVFTLSGARDLVALSDGVIMSIDVLAGSADVKPGDTVRKGQVLIRGEERAGKNGETNAVRAEGSVLARVWTEAESACALQSEEKRFTGRSICETHLITPFFTRKLAGENAFHLSETVKENTTVVGLFCPVKVVRSTHLEYERASAPVPANEARAAAEACAVAEARQAAPAGAKEHRILTSVAESGGYVRAEAVIEWILEIAHDKQGG